MAWLKSVIPTHPVDNHLKIGFAGRIITYRGNMWLSHKCFKLRSPRCTELFYGGLFTTKYMHALQPPVVILPFEHGALPPSVEKPLFLTQRPRTAVFFPLSPRVSSVSLVESCMHACMHACCGTSSWLSSFCLSKIRQLQGINRRDGGWVR